MLSVNKIVFSLLEFSQSMTLNTSRQTVAVHVLFNLRINLTCANARLQSLTLAAVSDRKYSMYTIIFSVGVFGMPIYRKYRY